MFVLSIRFTSLARRGGPGRPVLDVVKVDDAKQVLELKLG